MTHVGYSRNALIQVHSGKRKGPVRATAAVSRLSHASGTRSRMGAVPSQLVCQVALEQKFAAFRSTDARYDPEQQLIAQAYSDDGQIDRLVERITIGSARGCGSGSHKFRVYSGWSDNVVTR